MMRKLMVFIIRMIKEDEVDKTCSVNVADDL
jgi:hypothetical protein